MEKDTLDSCSQLLGFDSVAKVECNLLSSPDYAVAHNSKFDKIKFITAGRSRPLPPAV